MEMYQAVPFLDTKTSYDWNKTGTTDAKSEKGESFSDALNQELSQGEQVQGGQAQQQKEEMPSEPGKETGRETAAQAAGIPWLIQNPVMQQITAVHGEKTAPVQGLEMGNPQQIGQEGIPGGLAEGAVKDDGRQPGSELKLQPGQRAEAEPEIPGILKDMQPQKAEADLADSLKADLNTAMKTTEAKPLETAEEKDNLLLKPIKEQAEPETVKENKSPELIQTDRTAESSRNISFREPKTVQTASDVDMTDVKAGMQKLAESMEKQMAKGRTEFEIWLEPANLGKLAIKVAYESGKAMISITCLNDKTMELISQNAKQLGTILEQHTGTNTVVIVDQPETDYLQQKMDQESQNSYSGEEQQEKQDDDPDEDSRSFLQQLRLGLM